MKPMPIFTVDDDRYVRHSGALAIQFRWFEQWLDTEAHWWVEKHWWRE